MRVRTFALVLTLFAASLVRGENVIGWHTVAQGDTLEGITARYLGSPSAWRENWKLNPNVKDPNRLTPGQRLRVIVGRKLPARFADVWQVARLVERQPTPEPWVRASAGDRLRSRDGVRTHESSSAGLRFQDGATLVLTENSLVFLREPDAKPSIVPKDSIEIVSGQADVETQRAAKKTAAAEFEVIVGGATIKPKTAAPKSQTRARAAGKNAELMVYGGEATVEAAGAKLNVPTGMGTRVPEGAAPGPLEKLLPAPSAIEPLAGASRVGPTPFRWSAVDGAERYSIDVCRDPACAAMVDRASVTTTSWTPRALPSGELFWRVRAIPASRLDGFPTAPVAFTNHVAASGAIVDASSGAPFANARVVLYREATVAAETRTNAEGRYALPLASNGTYWIAVDSRTLGSAGTWAEQTFGPAGALCARGSGGTFERVDAGPCFGGRRGGVSDDARSFDTAEHVARIVAGESDVDRLDFRFSFVTVTTARDDASQPIQGSLRQFILNANVIPGPAEMQFVPAEAAAETFWTITAAAPLPDIVDDGTVLDGAARTFAGDFDAWNRGTVNASVPVGAAGNLLEPTERVDLEIVAANLPHAIVVRGNAAIRRMAVSGAAVNIEANGELALQNVIVGARADGSRAATPGGTGVSLAGHSRATLHRLYVADQTVAGVSTAAEARMLASHVAIARCGDGVALGSPLSDLRYSVITDCATAVNITASNNIVEQCTLARNRSGIASAAAGNYVRGNEGVNPSR